MLNKLQVQEKLKQFYLEDNHYGDISSSVFGSETQGELTLLSKDDGIFCGSMIIQESFNLIDDKTEVTLHVQDGEPITKGQKLSTIKGAVVTLLSMERIALNLIQRMSGIATSTHHIVNKVQDTEVKIIDTRKTTPGLGMFEKHAVQVGGGFNHRRTLNDGLMLKDNHLSFSQSIQQVVSKAKTLVGPMDKIEIEIEDEQALQEAIKADVDIIMFDNCTPEWISEHINKVPDHIKTEASGNINSDNVASYAKTGVDYISIGSLFYAQRALDISAKVVI
nr:carboxylating nicotinate-nucleotide diphosphorylase [Mammaliicoccus sp. Marseille-Q6498]